MRIPFSLADLSCQHMKAVDAAVETAPYWSPAVLSASTGFRPHSAAEKGNITFLKEKQSISSPWAVTPEMQHCISWKRDYHLMNGSFSNWNSPHFQQFYPYLCFKFAQQTSACPPWLYFCQYPIWECASIHWIIKKNNNKPTKPTVNRGQIYQLTHFPGIHVVVSSKRN